MDGSAKCVPWQAWPDGQVRLDLMAGVLEDVVS